MNTDQMVTEFHQSTAEILKVLQFRDRFESSKYNISPTQNHALHEIAAHDGITMSELSESMMLAISTMTRIVDQLVKRKLVKRIKGKVDKRICVLCVTKTGYKLLEQIDEGLFNSQKEILEKVETRYRGILLNAVKAFEKATNDWRNHETTHDPDLLQ